MPLPKDHNCGQIAQPERDCGIFSAGQESAGRKKAGAAAGLFAFACSRGDQYFATIGPPKV
jgi:hypothetical protein